MPAAVVVIDLTVPSLVSEIGPIVKVEGWSRLETGAVTLQNQDAVVRPLQKIPEWKLKQPWAGSILRVLASGISWCELITCDSHGPA